MVAATRSLLALLLCQVLLGGSAGLMPEVVVGRRPFSEPGRPTSAPQRPEDLLSEFELRLLHMFGLKRRPSPGKDVVIPPYMLDLYRLHAGQQLGQPPALGYPLERAASRANTVRSFHHEEVLEELPETSGKTARRFFFNLTSIPNEESITSAELQIFRKQVHGAFENNSSYHHRINIYEIIKPATATSKDPVTRLLDTRDARGIQSREGQKGWRSQLLPGTLLGYSAFQHLFQALPSDCCLTSASKCDPKVHSSTTAKAIDPEEWIEENAHRCGETLRPSCIFL
ncbi:bone morphogenetic protein 2 isoform X2 [Calypte anna]|uniref:bone morphogenetic protein 2 isoform X2 n=1 Tax=Calypte anna TaxID=9244 RepID=UPI0011C3AB7C|nr:bone morphogenetic protein 2 isoform X2 [Calypte anna]